MTVGIRMLTLRGNLHEEEELLSAVPEERSLIDDYANSIAHRTAPPAVPRRIRSIAEVSR